MPRRELTLESGGGTVRVKVLDGPDGPRVKPEYEDVLAAARALGKPPIDVARAVERDAAALLAKTKE